MAAVEKCFYQSNPGTASGNTNLYTVPAGKIAVVTEWNFSPSNGPADPYLYIGNIADTNAHIALSFGIPYGQTYQQSMGTNTSYQYKGMWVANGGETMTVAGSQTNGWQSIYGFETDGLGVSGRIPKRLGCSLVPAGGIAAYSTTGTTAAIVHTIQIQNSSSSQRQIGVRCGALPLLGWYDFIDGYASKTFNGPWYIPPNTTLTFDDFSGGGQIRMAAYGYEFVP